MSLAGTTWKFTLWNAGEVTFAFNADGSATVVGGSGRHIYTWGETQYGNFVMQTPNIYGTDAQIYFGLVQGNHAGGCYTNGKSASAPYSLNWFSMAQVPG